jgi:hypothetical protein
VDAKNQKLKKYQQQHFSRSVTVKSLKLKKTPDFIPTVPKGFDEQRFKTSSVDEKVKMIP